MTVMKSRTFRHGDVDGIGIDEIPKDVRLLDTKTIMYGEASGHHHTFDGQILVYEPQSPHYIKVDGEQRQIVKYIDVQKTASLVHQEHPAKSVAEGKYAILQEVEFDPLEQQIKRVTD